MRRSRLWSVSPQHRHLSKNRRRRKLTLHLRCPNDRCRAEFQRAVKLSRRLQDDLSILSLIPLWIFLFDWNRQQQWVTIVIRRGLFDTNVRRSRWPISAIRIRYVKVLIRRSFVRVKLVWVDLNLNRFFPFPLDIPHRQRRRRRTPTIHSIFLFPLRSPPVPRSPPRPPLCWWSTNNTRILLRSSPKPPGSSLLDSNDSKKKCAKPAE